MIVQRPDFSSNATFPDGEIESIENILELLKKGENILELLKKGTVFNKPLLKASCEQKTVEVEFAESYGISVRDRSLFDVLVFTGILDTNRGGYFIGTQNKVRNQTQPMKGDFPTDILSGTEIFFLKRNIIEQQHVAGAKAPILPVIETARKLTVGKLNITSSTTHKTFTELQFKKLVLNQSETFTLSWSHLLEITFLLLAQEE